MVYKRLALVDPRLVTANTNTNTPITDIRTTENERQQVVNSVQPQAPLINVLTHAYKELNDVLDNETMGLEEKMHNYRNALNRVQVLMRQYKMTSGQISSSSSSSPLLLPPPASRDLLSVLLADIPKANKSKTAKLYTVLKDSGAIKWNTKGDIISIEGDTKTDGNIVELLKDISRERKTVPNRPKGAEKLQKVLHKLNPNFSLVKNKLYHTALSGRLFQPPEAPPLPPHLLPAATGTSSYFTPSPKRSGADRTGSELKKKKKWAL